MNDKNKSTDNNPSNAEKTVETNFEELYKAARDIDSFKKYSDLELKEKIVNLLFSFDESNIDDSEAPIEKKERKIYQIIAQLEENLLKEKKPKESFEQAKVKIIERKNELISKIKEGLPIIYDTGSVVALLFKLAKDIDAYSHDVFWDFNNYSDRDFKKFKQNIVNSYYLLKTNFFMKIWDVLSGQKKEKLEQADPFNHIEIYPIQKQNALYGSNYYTAHTLNDGWVALCFGTEKSPPAYIPLEESFKYSLISLITNLSKDFDEIFAWAKVWLINKKDESFKEGPITNINLLFKLVSESFLPIINQFTVFNHIARSTPLNEYHPLRSLHLAYFIAWTYVRWISFLERTLNDIRNYVTPEGETGAVSLNATFEQIKTEMDSELVAVDFEEELTDFYSYFSEREEILKKIDYYNGFLPVLKRRIKILLNSLLGDVVQDYFEKKNYYFDYHLDEKGRLFLDSMNRKREDTLINKVMSLFKKEEAPVISPKPVQETQIEGEVSPSPLAKVSYSIQKDYSSYSRTLEDLLAILTAIASDLNANFSPENQFTTKITDKEDKYGYIRKNPFYAEQTDKVTFDQIYMLHDCYDFILITKSLGESVVQAIKDKEIPRSLYQKTDKVEEALEQLITLFKDTSGTLGIVTQHRDNYQEWITLLNRYQIVHTEFLKISKQNK